MANPLWRRLARLLGWDAREETMLDEPGALAQDLTGGRHALAYLRHLARGNTIRRKQLFHKVDEHNPPVLIIHGFLGTRGSMYILERRLVADGICVFSFNLG